MNPFPKRFATPAPVPPDAGAGAATSIPGKMDAPDDPAAGSALASLRERIDRLETDVRLLQSQGANRA